MVVGLDHKISVWCPQALNATKEWVLKPENLPQQLEMENTWKLVCFVTSGMFLALIKA